MQNLSQAFVKALEDGDITAAELEKIKGAKDNVEGVMKAVWEILDELGYAGEGDEWSQASAVKDTIREDTANRLAALLSTINLNVANINDILSHKSIAVRVINIEEIGGMSAGEYLRAIGG
jgi:hypothetical protein